MAYATKQIHNTRTGQTIRFLKTSEDTDGELLDMEATFKVHSREPAPHYHPSQVEDFTILAGELTVRISGQTRIYKQGESFRIPKQTIHSMWNEGDQQTVVNWQVRPALITEYFLETATGLANEGKTNQDGVPTFLQAVLLLNRFMAVYRLPKPAFAIQKVVFTALTPLAYLFGYRPTYKKYID
ncbi:MULTISPECIES: cupin domain-containing protein [unclassified Spirosoma]|uniref:cupin domain-containing protein n=1 Tax=unclassified Spirosoma TaxID=2621999 RepID=UPI0009685646|nr:MULTISPECIES: cupin domain-containing protein [unclassified Spirosoma]MBN8825235.1 cupin domain-containing protein [Spirosoma sp.]OJW75277.1 MAG: cupin [Spirosoma sp. 48-14]